MSSMATSPSSLPRAYLIGLLAVSGISSMQNVGGHVRANEKVEGAILKTYLRSIFGLSITIVYISLQE